MIASIHSPASRPSHQAVNAAKPQAPGKLQKPSESRTVELAKNQVVPLMSEKGQPDETPLWQFLGSPTAHGLLGGLIGGFVSTVGALALGFASGVEKTKMAKQSLMLAAGGILLGGGFSAWRMQHANNVYTAWMDKLGSEQATLGDLRKHSGKPESNS
jgi:hypothetical protein